jgi:hypothetical protein
MRANRTDRANTIEEATHCVLLTDLCLIVSDYIGNPLKSLMGCLDGRIVPRAILDEVTGILTFPTLFDIHSVSWRDALSEYVQKHPHVCARTAVMTRTEWFTREDNTNIIKASPNRNGSLLSDEKKRFKSQIHNLSVAPQNLHNANTCWDSVRNRLYVTSSGQMMYFDLQKRIWETNVKMFLPVIGAGSHLVSMGNHILLLDCNLCDKHTGPLTLTRHSGVRP